MSKVQNARKRFSSKNKNSKSDSLVKNISLKSNIIPDELLTNPALNNLISKLPSNYSFEIHKCIHQILLLKPSTVALQFPEGLLMFSLLISDIIKQFTNVNTIIMGDVTYGACCIDDYTARALGADFLIHYGHSCLVPIDQTSIKTMYVFVDIRIDTSHLIQTIQFNLPKHSTIALVSTIQFMSSLQLIKNSLSTEYSIIVPQSKPLSPGEILGCTAPNIPFADAIIYLGDGRFHLEAIMIANPHIPAFRYDPYSKTFTEELYNHELMQEQRRNAIQISKNAKTFGLILGTLGRQGSDKVLENIQNQLNLQNLNHTVVLLSEIFPFKLSKFRNIDAWIQISCPRLSIDWGYAFDKPLLSPYESAIVLKSIGIWDKIYPMDFYSKDSLGPWTPNHITKGIKAVKLGGETRIGDLIQ